MTPNTQVIKLYVRPCHMVSDHADEHQAITVGWAPLFNRMLLLRRTFTERVVFLSEEEVMAALFSGTMFLTGPLDLCWSILHSCNLRCSYCLDGGKGLMTPPQEEQNEHLHHICSSQTLLTVDICGGEPLLHRHLYDLLGPIKEAGIGITMTTHGGFLAQHAERLSCYLDGIRVSIDGSTAEKHNHLRGRTGAFERMIQGVKAARQNGIRIMINTVAMQPNMSDWEDIIQLAHDIGAAEIWLLQFLPLGLGSQHANTYAIDTDRFLAYGKELQARYTTADFAVRLRDNESAVGYVVAYANGFVFANGALDINSSDERQVPLGTLKDTNLDTLWQTHSPQHPYTIGCSPEIIAGKALPVYPQQ
jgi:molybdenum cofactor biosynthesis enzyme MoaA